MMTAVQHKEQNDINVCDGSHNIFFVNKNEIEGSKMYLNQLEKC